MRLGCGVLYMNGATQAQTNAKALIIAKPENHLPLCMFLVAL